MKHHKTFFVVEVTFSPDYMVLQEGHVLEDTRSAMVSLPAVKVEAALAERNSTIL